MDSVILTELGIAVFEDEKCTKAFPFSNPSEDYVFVKKGESRLSDLVKFLSKVNKVIEVNDQSLLTILKKKSIDAQLMNEDQINNIQSSKPKILTTVGFANDENDAMSKLREFAIQLSSSKVSEVSESPDLHIIQAINTLDETDKIMNGVSSRLREWYGLHFPELDNIVDSINGYSQIVLTGKRDALSKQVFEDAGFPDSKVEMLTLVREKSRGGDISDENLAIVQSLAKQILDLHELRKKLEEHVEKEMKIIAPNISAILGTSVAARILGRAGSLKNLSSMPASTIQVLGAEKALFRSLKTGSQPPKHGLLFQHALVHAAPRWQRGKIARAIAAKAAIAARVDVYGDGLNQVLLEKLNVRVDEISKKYKEPPIKTESDQNQFRDRPRQFRERPRQFRDNSKFKKSKSKKRKKFGRR
jgi:nucleolar protein 56